MEPECLHLPAQLQQVAVGDPDKALRHERVTQLVEDPDEGPRRHEAAIVGRAGDQVATGAPDTLLDEREPLAVGFLGEPAPDLRGRLGQVVLVACQLRPERGTQPAGGRGRGDGLRQPLDHRLVAPQHVVRLDAQRLARDGGGDVGVAVAVAADP